MGAQVGHLDQNVGSFVRAAFLQHCHCHGYHADKKSRCWEHLGKKRSSLASVVQNTLGRHGNGIVVSKVTEQSTLQHMMITSLLVSLIRLLALRCLGRRSSHRRSSVIELAGKLLSDAGCL